MQKLDRRLGVQDGFGVMASVTSAFHGMQGHLHEVGKERNEKLALYPYKKLASEGTSGA